MSVQPLACHRPVDVTSSLFDMDGTLVDSTAGVVGAWELFRQTYPSIDVANILSCEHRAKKLLCSLSALAHPFSPD